MSLTAELNIVVLDIKFPLIYSIGDLIISHIVSSIQGRLTTSSVKQRYVLLKKT